MRITEDKLLELGFERREDERTIPRVQYFIPAHLEFHGKEGAMEVGYVFHLGDYPKENPNCGLLMIYHGGMKNQKIHAATVPCPSCGNVDKDNDSHSNYELHRDEDTDLVTLTCNACFHELNWEEYDELVPTRDFPAHGMTIASNIWDDERLITIYESLTENKLPLEDADLNRFS